MSYYRYPSLHRPDSIRLVRLLPPAATDTSLSSSGYLYLERTTPPIKCKFKLAYLGEGVKYDAVSYCWGDGQRSRVIELGDQNQPFMVSPVVEDILIRLRDPNKERLLWLDLLCIDQNNKSDKDRQVKRMKDIFGDAQTVIVSLGPHGSLPQRHTTQGDYDGPRRRNVPYHGQPIKAMIKADRDLGTPASQYEYDEALKLITSIWAAAIGIAKAPLSRLDEGYLLQLLKKPWFERVWVVQEVAVAQLLVVICGDKEIKGKYFGRLHQRLFSRVRGEALRKRLLELGPLLSYMSTDPSDDPKPELLTLLQTYRPWKASDPRDKVYALLGLSADGLDATQLAPDYDLPVEALYRRVVEYMVVRYNSLGILTYAIESPVPAPVQQSEGLVSWLWCKFIGEARETSQKRDMPSWCPDWRLSHAFTEPPEPLLPPPATRKAMRRHNEAHNRIDSGSDYDSGVLKVSGFTIGTITSITDGTFEVVFADPIRERTFSGFHRHRSQAGSVGIWRSWPLV